MKKKPEIQNIVAKYANQFNKSAVFKDKTQYNRKEKHKKPDKGFFYVWLDRNNSFNSWMAFISNNFNIVICNI
jgi:hypothetical protein